ncbi:DUF4839 domain-containing protein [Streptomyces sp. NRRL B-1381]|uniref:DUF4839 domain-containing protein n=1 Tax=Streptomyces sp. NRRL B-1381 TaxID=1463829 RepID=UPI0004C0E164|nr:DUF4839 domain-containing protein [Streptomyces sp. NRRL B-1381]
MADEIAYEYKTVRTVRGADGLVISKMRKDGWELAGQAQSGLRTTLDFRRPKKPLPRFLIGAAVGGLVLLATVIGVAAALENGSEKEGRSSKPPAGTASAVPSATSTPTAAASASPEVITDQNNPELAALLKTPENCDRANVDFAAKYRGKTIAFDGSIVRMSPHGDYKTRYDFLLGPGDQGPRTGVGPAFKYEDKNALDLNLSGRSSPSVVRVGDLFRFVAEVGEYNPDQCLFFLDPVSTASR